MPGRKQGPVMLTAVPPNMLALSGAKTRFRFAPAVSKETFTFRTRAGSEWNKREVNLLSKLSLIF